MLTRREINIPFRIVELCFLVIIRPSLNLQEEYSYKADLTWNFYCNATYI